ncbi:MAG: hypothetical protein GY832_31160 [Chloroflexi bacterium]|nr:hypothetical protein [Chloroflexota bacterium]
MLFERIIAALTFRREVYAEVEHDTSFTTTAWMLVAVVALISQFGANASAVSGDLVGGLLNWVIAAVVGAIFAVLGFAAAAFITNAVGRALFNAEVTFEEMVRTMGLAYVWNVVGIIGIVAVFSDALACVLAPLGCIVPLLLLASTLIAVKEALDLEWGQTIITVIVGWVVQFIIMSAAAMLLGLMGLTAGAAIGFLG